MFQRVRMRFGLIHASWILVCFSVLFFAPFAQGQETGGDLVGGAGVFRPKNPESRRSNNPKRPRRARLPPADIEEKFDDALSDGNDARDGRKFAAAEASYRAALKLKARDARAFHGLGNVLVDQQRWDEAEDAYRKAVEITPNNPDALIALSFVLVQPRTGAVNARRFADAEYFAKRATQLQSNSAAAFDRLGVAMIARGIFNSETEAAFRRAVELDPVFFYSQLHLPLVLRRLNRAREPDSLYKAAIDQAKDAPTQVLIA